MIQRSECLYNEEIIGIESIYTVVDGKQINIPDKVEALRKLGRDGLLRCPCGCGKKLILVAGDKGLRQQHFRERNGESWSECTLKQEGMNSIDSKVVIKCWLADKMDQNIETRVPISRIRETDRKYEVSHYVPAKDFAVNYTNLRINLEDEKMDALESAFGDRILHIVDEDNIENFSQYPEFMNKIQKRQRYCIFLQTKERDYDQAVLFSAFYEKDIDGLFKRIDLSAGLLRDYGFTDDCILLFNGTPVSVIYEEKRNDFLKEQEQEKERRAEAERKWREEQEKRRIEKEKRDAARKKVEEDRLARLSEFLSKQESSNKQSENSPDTYLKAGNRAAEKNAAVIKDPISIREKAEREIDSYIDRQYTDSQGNRWFKCTECGKVGKRDEFKDIAHARGTCNECYKRIHGELDSDGEGIFGRSEIKRHSDPNICPWCGNQLIKRNGPYGPLWGCSGYPKCTFKKKINL